MTRISNRIPRLALCTPIIAICCNAGFVHALEIITFRSGQSGGSPGTAGMFDDTVRYNPWGNPTGPVSGAAFTAADFAAAAAGPAAVVVDPGPWMGGAVAPLTDPLARWINFGLTGTLGAPGSALYAVPFWVNTTSITSATITFEGGADELLGDWWTGAGGGGPNPDGVYVNGVGLGYMYQGFNFAFATTHTQSITTMVNPGLNHLYFYQRDLTGGLSGIIFSATIEVVPAPGALALLGVAGLAAARRRR